MYANNECMCVFMRAVFNDDDRVQKVCCFQQGMPRLPSEFNVVMQLFGLLVNTPSLLLFA